MLFTAKRLYVFSILLSESVFRQAEMETGHGLAFPFIVFKREISKSQNIHFGVNYTLHPS